MRNLTKVRKRLAKSGVPTTLSQPTEWISTGNAALNFAITGTFHKGFPNKRSVCLAGEQGSGKSLLAGTAAKHWQDKGYFVIYIDSEDAIDPTFLEKIGVNMDEDHFLPIRIATIEEASEVMAHLFSEYEEGDKIAVFVDSITMLATEAETAAFDKGGLANDMGLFAKKVKQFLKNTNAKMSDKDMAFLYTAHAYQNQDLTNGQGRLIVSGGTAQLYIPSISLMFSKLKLRDGGKVEGIRLKSETMKTRFYKLGTTTTLHIPYDTGIDFYDGILDFLEESGVVTKNGAWYSYINDEGDEVKFQSSKLHDHIDNLIPSEEDEVVTENEDIEVD